MEPRSGYIMQLEPTTHPSIHTPTHQPTHPAHYISLKSVLACKMESRIELANSTCISSVALLAQLVMLFEMKHFLTMRQNRMGKNKGGKNKFHPGNVPTIYCNRIIPNLSYLKSNVILTFSARTFSFTLGFDIFT